MNYSNKPFDPVKELKYNRRPKDPGAGSDKISDFPPEAVVWLHQGHITPKMVEDYGILWHEKERALQLPCAGGHQWRYFAGKQKYLTSEGCKGYIALPGKAESPVVIVVEDILSAMHLRECGYSSVATLGTALNTEARLALRGLMNDTTKALLVWYDNDNMKVRQRARKVASQLNGLSVPVKIVDEDVGQDPKLYNVFDIDQILYRIVNDTG